MNKIDVPKIFLGDEELIQNAPLLAMIYDRPNKGNNLAIEVGKDQITYGYSIDALTQILLVENSKSEIKAIWIAESSGWKTLEKVS